MSAVCRTCGAPLSNDEIGLYKKLVSRRAEDFLCIRCLAETFSCDEALLREKIKQFKESGCMLFV
ncbi:hypothetical protein H6A12_11450 [Phocea massiliensis]|uniref:Uncharacterized protein n=1 Tax=Merdimmobilis hominis TaxID=2897707 RepID=A0A938X9U8_9FIRM|nr:hypothetical protein [Merdimmobilis hominis]